MYEICALLRAPAKPKKPRKPAAPRVAAGCRVLASGTVGTVVDRHPDVSGWWLVEFVHPVTKQVSRYGYARSALKVQT
jgi:hypothetical protein